MAAATDDENEYETYLDVAWAENMIRKHQPRKLALSTNNPKKNRRDLSYSYAVLQCLSAVIDPDWIRANSDHIPEKSNWSFSTTTERKRLSLSEVHDKIVPAKSFSKDTFPATLLLQLLSWMREPDDGTTVYPYRWQRIFSRFFAKQSDEGDIYGGDQEQDAVDYLHHVLNCLSIGENYGKKEDITGHPAMDALFAIFYEGPHVKGRGSREIYSGDKCLPFWISYIDVSDPPEPLSLPRRVRPPHVAPLEAQCEECGKTAKCQPSYVRAYFPHNYIFVLGQRSDGTEGVANEKGVEDQEGAGDEKNKILERRTKDKISSKGLDWIALEEEVTLGEEFRLPDSKSGEQPYAIYRLQAVIKHAGEDFDRGHYVAFTRTRDDKWWKCDEKDIEPSNISDILDMHNDDNGQPYILFYQKKPKKVAPD